MGPRHRTPSIFNLSMVDILCCALGCVILLWLVKQQAADAEAAENRAVSKKLVHVTQLKAALELQLKKNREARAYLDQQLTLNKKTRDRLNQELAAALKEGRRLDLALKRTEGNLDSVIRVRDALKMRVAEDEKNEKRLEALLASRLKELESTNLKLKKNATLLVTRQQVIDALTKKSNSLNSELTKTKQDRDRIAKANEKIPILEKDLAKTNTDLKQARIEGAKAAANLITTQEQLDRASKALKAMQAAKTKVDEELSANQKNLKTTTAKVTELEKKLLEQLRAMQSSNRKVTALQGERDNLAAERRRLQQKQAALQQALDQRFAGIELKGRRVMFLVDTSGSMKLLKNGTEAKDKWQRVQESIAKVMKSLQNLEKFQLVTFAEETSFRLGNKGKWIDYKGEESVKQAIDALSKIDPIGGTDLHTALEAAFEYRKEGMDTIYVFSDGLPSVGSGVTAEEEKRIGEQAATAKRAQLIRKKLREEWNVGSEAQPRVRIHAVGFFFESPDVGAFLWALARENDGSFVGMSKP